MKKLCLLILATTGFVFTNAQTPEEMKAWEAQMTPGAQHKWMAAYAGEWDADIKMWMDPSQPPTTSKGSSTNTMIMGGRYMEYKFTGDFMGMPFEGQGVMGYDNAAQKFFSTWCDSMSTGLMYMEGTLDEKTNTLTSVGESVDPLTKKTCQTKEITKYISKDQHVMEMYMVTDGQEVKMMEITYTRKK